MAASNINVTATWASVPGITWQCLYFPLGGRPSDVTAISRQLQTVNTRLVKPCKSTHSNKREHTKLGSIIFFFCNSKSI
jgi:hypothetical protein